MVTVSKQLVGTDHEFPAYDQNMDESIKGAQSCCEPLASPTAGKSLRACSSSSLGTVCLRCQGYVRTKARSVTPATWLCVPFLQQEEPTRASSSPLKGEEKGRGQMGRKSTQVVRNQLLPISSTHDSLNRLVPMIKS